MRITSSRSILFLAIFISALFLVFVSGPRVNLEPYHPQPIAVQAPVEQWLAQQESQVSGIRPGEQKQILWAYSDHRKTPLALIYLHGLSAGPLEMNPVLPEVGKALGANVFVTRLKGHAVPSEQLRNVHAQDWFYDAEEALAVALELGEKVVVVGTSTGGALGVWLASQHPQIAALITISPNFGPKNKLSELILLPWGPVLTRIIQGDTYSFVPANVGMAAHWTTSYPVEALFSMMSVVSQVRQIAPQQLRTPVLLMRGQSDEVVDLKLAKRFYQQLGSMQKAEVVAPSDRHIICGEYTQPDLVGFCTKKMTEWIHSVVTLPEVRN